MSKPRKERAMKKIAMLTLCLLWGTAAAGHYPQYPIDAGRGEQVCSPNWIRCHAAWGYSDPDILTVMSPVLTDDQIKERVSELCTTFAERERERDCL